SDDRVHSPREFFHGYLQSLDVEVGGLPDSFRARLARALRHYDVLELDRTPDLEEAVYRLFLALERFEAHVPVVTALLDRWIERDDTEVGISHELNEVLDRLIVATQVRFPVIGDTARNLRYRYFEEPVIRKAREQVYDGVRGSLAYLAEHAQAADYA